MYLVKVLDSEKSKVPSNAPTKAAITMTTQVRRIVSSRLGHTAFLNSDMTSCKNWNGRNRCTVCCEGRRKEAVPEEGRFATLPHLSVCTASPAPRAVFSHFQSLGIIASVFRGGVVSFTAVGALQRNNDTGFSSLSSHGLVNYLGNNSCADSSSTFPYGEVKPFFHSNGVDHADFHDGVVSRHDHLYSFFQLDFSSNVAGSDEELRFIASKEWRMPSTLILT